MVGLLVPLVSAVYELVKLFFVGCTGLIRAGYEVGTKWIRSWYEVDANRVLGDLGCDCGVAGS